MLKMRAAAATVVARGSCSMSGARWCGAARRAFGQMAHSPRDSPNSIGFNRIKCKYHCQAHIYAQNKQQKWAARPGCSTGANKSSNDASNPLAKVPQQRPSGILLPYLIIDSIERGALAAPGQHWSVSSSQLNAAQMRHISTLCVQCIEVMEDRWMMRRRQRWISCKSISLA